MSDILVVGGSNIDIKATASHAILLHDSNIGRMSVSFGGVSRNVVENLLRLSDDVFFLTAVGKDSNGRSLVKELEDLGGTVLSMRDDKETSHYIAIHDENGDMFVAVCVSEILDTLKKEHVQPFEKLLSEHEKIVFDTNLSKEAIDYLLSLDGHKFYVEGVSANKIVRLRDRLDRIQLLKCNRLEAGYLLSMEGADGETLLRTLYERGIRQAVVTDSSNPVLVLDEGRTYTVPVTKATNVVSTMGCGDALFAGLLHGLHDGWDLKDAVTFGIKLSSITIQSPYAVDPDIGKKAFGR